MRETTRELRNLHVGLFSSLSQNLRLVFVFIVFFSFIDLSKRGWNWHMPQSGIFTSGSSHE